MFRAPKIIFLLLPALFFSSCGLKKMTVRATSDVFETGMPVVERESEVDVARTVSLVSLKQMEAFLQSDPENKKLLTLLTKAYGSYAFGFLEEDALRQRTVLPIKEEFYKRGLEFGLRALRLKKTDSLATFQKRAQHIGKKEVSALFWTAFNWSSVIRQKPDAPQNLIDLAKVNFMMQRVEVLVPHYQYGAVDAYFGAQESMKPAILGGSEEKAKKYFESAIQKGGDDYLMNTLLYLQFFALDRDMDLARSLEEKILNADAAALPEQRLANELAKRRVPFLMREVKYE